jgi:DUF1365 family protein
MTDRGAEIYLGDVVHTRLQPIFHKLRYRVFCCLFDCRQLDQLASQTKLFSRNRFNLCALYDADHTDGCSLEEYHKSLVASHAANTSISHFLLLCYPRILGYAFNPLAIHFGIDLKGDVALVAYEVRNTFGERMTYVVPAENQSLKNVSQHCDKQFFVSPFNAVEGKYLFNASFADQKLAIGVALKVDDRPIMKAYFSGQKSQMTDNRLLRALGQTGWMTMKVILAIHFEAAKLWCKGMCIHDRPAMPKRSIVRVENPQKGQ